MADGGAAAVAAQRGAGTAEGGAMGSPVCFGSGGHQSAGASPDHVAIEDLRAMQREPRNLPEGCMYRANRRQLVLWVAGLCKKFKLSNKTVHLAVAYLDSHVGKDLESARYFPYAAAAMLIGAKVEERPDAVPYISELLKRHPGMLSAGDISAAEITLLQAMSWRACAVTFLNFLGVHFNQGVVFSGDRMELEELGCPHAHLPRLLKFAYFFADACLLETRFCAYSKAHGAAAIIAAARYTLQVVPIWPPRLAESTGFGAEAITAPVHLILETFSRDWPDDCPPHLTANLTPCISTAPPRTPPRAPPAEAVSPETVRATRTTRRSARRGGAASLAGSPRKRETSEDAMSLSASPVPTPARDRGASGGGDAGEAATPNRMEVVTGAGGDEDARAPKSRRLGRARCGHPQAGSVLEL